MKTVPGSALGRAPLTTFFLAMLLAASNGFPGGAPYYSCRQMNPSHNAVSQPLSTLPYSITLSHTVVQPGQIVTVTIDGTRNEVIMQGFMAVSRNQTGHIVSGMTPPTSSDHKTLDCMDGQKIIKSGMTHTRRLGTFTTSFQWRAPYDALLGAVYEIRVTVVQDISTFWVAYPNALTIGLEPEVSTHRNSIATIDVTSAHLIPISASIPSQGSVVPFETTPQISNNDLQGSIINSQISNNTLQRSVTTPQINNILQGSILSPQISNSTFQSPLPTPQISNSTFQSPLPTPQISNSTLQRPLPTPQISNSTFQSPLPTPQISNSTFQSPLPTPQISNSTFQSPLPTPQISNSTLQRPLPTPQISNNTLQGSVPTPHTSNNTLQRPLPQISDILQGSAATPQVSTSATQRSKAFAKTLQEGTQSPVSNKPSSLKSDGLPVTEAGNQTPRLLPTTAISLLLVKNTLRSRNTNQERLGGNAKNKGRFLRRVSFI